MPHIIHCMEVMLAVKKEFENNHEYLPHDGEVVPLYGYSVEELMIIAILHDVVEDTTVTLDTIRAAYGDKIADAVDALTRRKGEPYRDFIYRAKANPGGRFVKLADVYNNRERTNRISPKKAKWREKLEYKYDIAGAVLQDDSGRLTWELASATYQWDSGMLKYVFVADANGKRRKFAPQKDTVFVGGIIITATNDIPVVTDGAGTAYMEVA